MGQVYVDGPEVNAVLVRRGYAWGHRKFSDDAELLALEAGARDKGLGLWADPKSYSAVGVAAWAAGVNVRPGVFWAGFPLLKGRGKARFQMLSKRSPFKLNPAPLIYHPDISRPR